MGTKSVEGYIDSLEPWQANIVEEVRKIILDTVPDASETIKWAQPVYEMNGPFAYIKAFKKAVNFGFWRGVELNDPEGRLVGTGEKMRHIKLSGDEDIDQDLFSELVSQAVELNRTKGDPTRD